MSIDAITRHPHPRRLPEATNRYVKSVLGTEEDPRILGEAFHASQSDHGGPYVIKPYGDLLSPAELWDVRQLLLGRLAEVGLTPALPMSRVESRTEWDRIVGTTLLESLPLEPFQAHSAPPWTYLTVHLLPEFAGWRFPGRNRVIDGVRDTAKPEDRVKGGRRNVLYRVWYRALVLGPDHRFPDETDPLGEDEFDNIFGRPKIARHFVVTRAIVDAIVRNQPLSTGGRHEVVRELMKEVRRRFSLVHFAGLDEDLHQELDRLWELSVRRRQATSAQ